MCIRTAILNSLFLPESFWGSSHGYSIEADFICPQAFGRNMFHDDYLSSIRAMRDITNSDIDTFEWLRSSQFDPGGPNKMLAKRCLKLARLGHPFLGEKKLTEKDAILRPVIGQWEVLYTIYSEEPDWYTENQHLLFPIWPSDKGQFTSRNMLLEASTIAETHDWHNPLIVAHPEHIQRCFFVARKIFRGSIAIDHDWNTDKEWFDKQSVQSWTRTPKAWLIYEIRARIHHRLHGWM